MLFNSYEFIFLFMPVAFSGFFLIAKKSYQGAIAWLGLTSIFFYGYWSLSALPVMMISICMNYCLGIYLSNPRIKYRQPLLVFSITLNLLVLGYFKYADFFIANTNTIRVLMGMDPLSSLNIILPIGISFFTFTQIAFLIDCYQDKMREQNFLQYVLFVTFFPHLIAGPLMHHKQMMPQFANSKNYSINCEKIKLGIIIFTLGFAKKILLADPLGAYADVLFNGINSGLIPEASLAWLCSIAYTFQIYFDFSGYSDMAIGISLFFGIWLPFNFNSPLRATSVIDFWQRWHISLTKYIGQYLYTPVTLACMRLGQGKAKPVELIYSLIFPTLMVFLILGIWHGASWTYVIFGGIHGIYVVTNHLWRKIYPINNKRNKDQENKLIDSKKLAGWLITFLCVNISFVMFRAGNVTVAVEIYKTMLGFGITQDARDKLTLFDSIHDIYLLCIYIFVSFIVIIFGTSTLMLAKKYESGESSNLYSSYAPYFFGVLFMICITRLGRPSPFLYFQF